MLLSGDRSRRPPALLLDAGADANIRDDNYKATALGWADFFGRTEFAELIRERGGRR